MIPATQIKVGMVILFDGKPCRVVTLVPKNEEFPYSRYRLWFGTEDSLLWQVEVYDGDRLLASVPARDFRKDLVDKGEGDGNHGFKLVTPPA